MPEIMPTREERTAAEYLIEAAKTLPAEEFTKMVSELLLVQRSTCADEVLKYMSENKNSLPTTVQLVCIRAKIHEN